MVGEKPVLMQSATLLQTDATVSKNHILRAFMDKALAEYNHMLSERTKYSYSLMGFHRKVYPSVKSRTSFSSQVICDLERSAWHIKGDNVKSLTIKFNIPRNCRIFHTNKRLFVKLVPYPKMPFPFQSNPTTTSIVSKNSQKKVGSARPLV